jgi:phage terminase large subunit
MDYGLDMLACLWIAELPDGSLAVYRELHESGLIVSQAAHRILALCGNERYERILMPPDLDGRQKDSGKSVLSLFAENGVKGTRADNRRVPGWLAVKELLKPIPSPDGQGVRAKLQIFTSCYTLIRHLPALMRDRRNPTDAGVEPHEVTHICDALRYFALNYSGIGAAHKGKDPLTVWREKAIRKNGKGNVRHRF